MEALPAHPQGSASRWVWAGSRYGLPFPSPPHLAHGLECTAGSLVPLRLALGLEAQRLQKRYQTCVPGALSRAQGPAWGGTHLPTPDPSGGCREAKGWCPEVLPGPTEVHSPQRALPDQVWVETCSRCSPGHHLSSLSFLAWRGGHPQHLFLHFPEGPAGSDVLPAWTADPLNTGPMLPLEPNWAPAMCVLTCACLCTLACAQVYLPVCTCAFHPPHAPLPQSWHVRGRSHSRELPGAPTSICGRGTVIRAQATPGVHAQHKGPRGAGTRQRPSRPGARQGLGGTGPDSP